MVVVPPRGVQWVRRPDLADANPRSLRRVEPAEPLRKDAWEKWTFVFASGTRHVPRAMGHVLRRILPILLAGALLQGASGLYAVIIPLVLEAKGVSSFWNGVTAAVYSLGFLVGCFVGPKYVRDVGHIRAFSGFAAVASVIVLALALDVGVVLATLVRGLLGLCMAVLLSVAETWIADGTPEKSRGGVISLYFVMSKVALGSSPFVVAGFDASVLPVFMASSALYSLALVPVTLTRIENPTPPSAERIGPRRVFARAPTAGAGAFVAGLVNGGVLAVLPIYTARLGFDAQTVALTIAAAHGLSLIVQWPAGKLSDQVDRRLVILGLAVAATTASAALAAIGDQAGAWMVIALVGFWGAASLSSYSVCMAHGADVFPKDQLVGMGSTLLLLFAGGQIAGPLLAGGALSIGPGGLFVFSGASSGMFALFIVARMVMKSRPAGEGDPFQAAPNTSPQLIESYPRGPTSQDESAEATP